jgi:hypothetical protein
MRIALFVVTFVGETGCTQYQSYLTQEYRFLGLLTKDKRVALGWEPRMRAERCGGRLCGQEDAFGATEVEVGADEFCEGMVFGRIGEK